MILTKLQFQRTAVVSGTLSCFLVLKGLFVATMLVHYHGIDVAYFLHAGFVIAAVAVISGAAVAVLGMKPVKAAFLAPALGLLLAMGIIGMA